MEVTECTKLVLDKIQSIEPENATKIIGYLLLNHTHQEIMEYAFGSEQQIHSLIREAKSYLALSPKPIARPEQAISRPFSSSSPFRVPAPYMTPHSSLDLMPPSYNEIASLEEQLRAINPLALDITSNPFYSLRSHNGLPQFPTKVCQYYYRGYCRHGSYCKFLHDPAYGVNANELLYNDDLLFGSLEQLEVEISELLKASNGMPVSIASLPSMYQEKYGKNLQAEGYLTESQRHGKAGFSLTKLLARLNSVRLIDRPHGQHSVVLAEDAPKFECRGEGNDTGAVLPSSHQIYLTFPAESSFTDEDVMNYFKQFGPVRDVRIPRQEKRMFGFVSFHSSETVRAILSKGHPHHICGSRVLVKPYKEKTRMYDRKYTERAEFPLFYPPQYFDMESELHSMPRVYETSNLVQKQLMREQTSREVERMRFLELQISPKPLTSHSYFNYGIEDLNTLTDHFSPSPIVQNNGSTSDDPISQQMMNKFSDQDSGNVELPDSPFASRFDNKVYTVV